MVREIISYQTSDGAIFHHKNEANEHEKNLSLIEGLNGLFNKNDNQYKKYFFHEMITLFVTSIQNGSFKKLILDYYTDIQQPSNLKISYEELRTKYYPNNIQDRAYSLFMSEVAKILRIAGFQVEYPQGVWE